MTSTTASGFLIYSVLFLSAVSPRIGANAALPVDKFPATVPSSMQMENDGVDRISVIGKNTPQFPEQGPTACAICRRRLLMRHDLCRAGCLENALGLGHLVGCAVSDDEELVRLERRLVLHDAVFRNPNAVQRRAQRA